MQWTGATAHGSFASVFFPDLQRSELSLDVAINSVCHTNAGAFPKVVIHLTSAHSLVTLGKLRRNFSYDNWRRLMILAILTDGMVVLFGSCSPSQQIQPTPRKFSSNIYDLRWLGGCNNVDLSVEWALYDSCSGAKDARYLVRPKHGGLVTRRSGLAATADGSTRQMYRFRDFSGSTRNAGCVVMTKHIFRTFSGYTRLLFTRESCILRRNPPRFFV